ncbi:hypothetical protein [Curtobacterium aetherium]|uniref:Uncharacterized protein n=1 Tax=Curtobacterium aetherium TaxID=2841594 RepID=A0ACD1E7U9_9MICO|nr:hypothetical protein [Curtobacterium sp. L6-1]QWS34894.1 hypothetical protein KM842_07155 [Curtobacterium sp. L6-1]
MTLAPAPTRARTRPAAFAWLSMLLGGGSVALALVEPQHEGVSTGFVASTIGVTAIVVGTHAVRLARWGSPTVRAFGRGGALLGGIGSALMAYAVLAFGLSTTGIVLPPLSLAIEHTERTLTLPEAERQPAAVEADAPAAVAGEGGPAEVGQSTAEAPPAAVTVPAAPLPPLTAAEERSALMQTVGTLSFVLRQRFEAGPFPPALVVESAPQHRITLADGSPLVALPPGAQVTYSVSADAASWSVSVVGAQFGATATYDSRTGVVEAH